MKVCKFERRKRQQIQLSKMYTVKVKNLHGKTLSQNSRRLFFF